MTNTDKTVSAERLADEFATILRHIEDGDFYHDYDRATASLDTLRQVAELLASRTQEPAEWHDVVKKVAYELMMHKELRITLSQMVFLDEAVSTALRAASITPPAPERSKEEVGVTVEALFEHGVTQQTQNYQFEQTGTGAWLFRCDEWLNITEVLSALEPASLHKGEDDHGGYLGRDDYTAKGAYAEYQESARLLLKEGGE